MVLDKPQLLFEVTITRKQYFRRALWMLLAAVAAGAAWVVLDETRGREVADAQVLQVGQIVALALVVILLLRMVLNFVTWFRTKNETVQLFDRGVRWQRGKKQHQYSWSNLKTFQNTARITRFLRRPIIQRGGLIFTMRDGQVLTLKPSHGNLAVIADELAPIIADITGTRMGQALRNNKMVRLHTKLVLQSAGVMAGKHKIRWSAVDVTVKHNQLHISELQKDGRFKVVQTFKTQQIINLPGLLDVTDSLIRNHQPDRFNIKTYG